MRRTFPVSDDRNQGSWPPDELLEDLDGFLDQDDCQDDGEEVSQTTNSEQRNDRADSKHAKKPRRTEYSDGVGDRGEGAVAASTNCRKIALSRSVHQSVVSGNAKREIQITTMAMPPSSHNLPTVRSSRCSGAFSPLGRRRRPATRTPAILTSRRSPSSGSQRSIGVDCSDSAGVSIISRLMIAGRGYQRAPTADACGRTFTGDSTCSKLRWTRDARSRSDARCPVARRCHRLC